MTKNQPESKRLAKMIGAKPQQCYGNAFHAMFDIAEYRDATYVEGYAVGVPDGHILEHGWLEQDEEIIDPTLPDVDLAYFPGLTFHGATAVTQAAIKNGTNELPIFYCFGWGGMDSKEMMQTWNDALGFVKALPATPAQPAEAKAGAQ